MSVFDGVRRLLVAHAHPDDESLAGGSLLVQLARRGVEIVLVTAARGEQGEVVAGPLSHLAGSPELVTQREAELAQAAQTLGIARSYFLGTSPARADGLPERRYEDSGMRWIRDGLAGPAETASPQSFTSADPAEAVADLAALIAHEQPDLVLSYDSGGGYGHPDHIRMHEVARDAAAKTGVAFAVLVDDPQAQDAEWFEAPEAMPVVFDALRAHRTQLTVDEPYVVHSGGQRELLEARTGVRRLAR
ncbi:GlcNAc-PI de-N-acetylase [Epidermidibacterium keratini]|uniref:GlcNAc-PI de-N-acetylase n=1 Tax=Epidermidibacterium keratini TaxID=1891644 RepID=A0A7L4YSG6_9ACTN|nr:PIG-L family deacetylase [Epidermidibacterium keratini]QHC02175.1 GlcNAc-PI de-N-acetylase [Epidermidibacterium keratini]